MKYYQKKEWQITRKQGKGIFILQYGGFKGILISILLFILFFIYPAVTNAKLSYSMLQEPEIVNFFIVFLFFGFLVGCAFGLFSWYYKEDEYNNS